MHAASVHPEPGSNSLNFVYLQQISLSLNILELILLYYYLRASFTFFQKNFRSFVCLSCCSIFNEPCLSPLSATTFLLYHIPSRLSIPFFNFFQLFSGISLSASGSLVYHISTFSVKSLFSLFLTNNLNLFI